jgi:predicted PhzF superfamily epimerase YddE/YHI9
MNTLPIYQIDAFTSRLFSGNPACVCLLQVWPSDDIMQEIAAENNVSETAFICSSSTSPYIRWFTPTVEVDLCGHATLAAAHVMLNVLNHPQDFVIFDSKSGPLSVTKRGKRLELDFPGRVVEHCDNPPKSLFEAIPGAIIDIYNSGNQTYIVELADEDAVRTFRPDFLKLVNVDKCVNITARGKNHDFVSRFFGPNIGLPEDPVTGSAHCGLAIYWSRKLGKTTELSALQLSKRTGELYCRVVDDRVLISGEAVLYLRGEITI